MMWRDRLGGSPQVGQSALEQAPWRYVLDLGSDTDAVHLGGRPLVADLRAISLLLGPEELHVHWAQRGERREQRLRVATQRERSLLPPPIELRRLQMTDPAGTPREGVTSDAAQTGPVLFPLASPPEELEDYDELISLIENNASPIAGICSRPRLSLRVAERAEELRRARRMTHRTAPYLARHSEDWEGQSLRMPFPRRLLTAVPEDQWSTYENRMVRTVVRDAHAELMRRGDALRSILQQLDEALQIVPVGDQFERKDWARMERMYRALRGNVLGSELAKERERLKRQLERLRKAATLLGSARSSPLFRKLGAVPDERELRPTNLLLHDSAYHSALLVRRKLNRLMHVRNARPITDPLPPYFRWLKLALDEALDQTGFKQEAPQRYAGHDWLIEVSDDPQLYRISLSFRRSNEPDRSPAHEARNGNATLPTGRQRKPSGNPPSPFRPSRAQLVILPLWLNLADQSERQLMLTQIAASDTGARYLVVFPGDAAAGSCEHFSSADQFPHLATAAAPGRLDSIEVLARELVRETWLRDLLERRWPRWCLSCPQDEIGHGDRKKFVCPTCKLEAGLTQERCRCGQEHEVPYFKHKPESLAAGAIGRSDVVGRVGGYRCAVSFDGSPSALVTPAP